MKVIYDQQNISSVRIVHFKTQLGPIVKNATLEPQPGNRTHDPANIVAVLCQLSYKGR